MSTLLQIEDLKTQFPTNKGIVRAVDGVSLSVEAGETLGVVGESGCGKSVTMLSVMRLIPNPLLPQLGGRIAGGHIWFEGQDLLALAEPEMRKIRGNKIAMIFQDPMTSLNPTMRIGRQLTESIMLHRGFNPQAAKEEALRLLELVEIPSAAERLDDYPYQFSGGMRQRVMIAIALAGSPQLLIADEPTTALDVTIQAQILDLLAGLQAELGMAIILISHNLGVVAGLSNRIAVMYAGKLIELAPADALFARPAHPYTRALLNAVPSLGASRKERLANIPGAPPDLIEPPAGCRFHPRCDCAQERCRLQEPPLRVIGEGHSVACFTDF
jgi:oligopeptide transport system ATP-binding protein